MSTVLIKRKTLQIKIPDDNGINDEVDNPSNTRMKTEVDNPSNATNSSNGYESEDMLQPKSSNNKHSCSDSNKKSKSVEEQQWNTVSKDLLPHEETNEDDNEEKPNLTLKGLLEHIPAQPLSGHVRRENLQIHDIYT